MAIIPFTKPALPAEGGPQALPAEVRSADGDADGLLSTSRLIKIGLAVMGVFVLGSLIWAAFAPLSGAIVAGGKVAVEGQWKVVEAPQAGIITELNVTEGQEVAKGDLLVALDETQASAAYQSYKSQYLNLVGQRAKLLAEQQGLADIEFPEVFTANRADPEVQQIIARQEEDFHARRSAIQAKTSHIEAQRLVAQQELDALKGLDQQGLVARSRIYPLKYALADLDGQAAEVQEQWLADSAAKLQQVEADLAAVTPKVNAAATMLSQLDIRATASGKVLGLTEYTVGGVVSAGEKMMNIVPSPASFIVEASVKPDDIDDLSPGLAAEIRLTALQRRVTPTIKGVVTYVAADRITSDKADYYGIKVRIDDNSLSVLGPQFHLYPGMPVEVMIPTRKRTALDYLIEPLTDTIFKSFREP